MSSNKAIYTTDAPQPIGPYSQAIFKNGWLYISGQLAVDPLSGQYIQGTVKEETKLALQNIGAILKEAGSSYEEVVKVSIFLQRMKDFPIVNEVYAHYFPADGKTPPPARETLEVAALPLGVQVEISCIAYIDRPSASCTASQ